MGELRLDRISRTYGKSIKALNDFSFCFTNGIYGLMGENGAGKSTLSRLITMIEKPSEGHIYFDDKDIWDIGDDYKKAFGYMPQSQSVYSGFTLEHFLYYMASLKGISKAEAREQIPRLIKAVNLQPHTKKKLGTFSGGMRQRALLAQALLGDPSILILDEPTAGLDPKERISIRNMISEIALSKIVIIATHIVQDIETIAKEILVMSKGSLIMTGTTVELCEQIEGKVWEVICDEASFNAQKDNYRIVRMRQQATGLCVRLLSDIQPSIEALAIQRVSPDLEDVYLYYLEEV